MAALSNKTAKSSLKKRALLGITTLVTYENNGKKIVANRRSAAVLLVEPKIKSTIDGKIEIEYAHEDVNIVIKGKRRDQIYYQKK